MKSKSQYSIAVIFCIEVIMNSVFIYGKFFDKPINKDITFQ